MGLRLEHTVRYSNPTDDPKFNHEGHKFERLPREQVKNLYEWECVCCGAQAQVLGNECTIQYPGGPDWYVQKDCKERAMLKALK
jgi:hypothetical protein